MTGPRLPDFVIIGAGKSGTTTLHHWLLQQPEIFSCSLKEPRFRFLLEPEVRGRAGTCSGRPAEPADLRVEHFLARSARYPDRQPA
jgi:hypothetical protein